MYNNKKKNDYGAIIWIHILICGSVKQFTWRAWKSWRHNLDKNCIMHLKISLSEVMISNRHFLSTEQIKNDKQLNSKQHN